MADIPVYHQGEVALVTVVITNAAGALTDPLTVTCAVKNEDGTYAIRGNFGSDGAIVRNSPGSYTATIPCTTPGACLGSWSWSSPSGASPIQYAVLGDLVT